MRHEQNAKRIEKRVADKVETLTDAAIQLATVEQSADDPESSEVIQAAVAADEATDDLVRELEKEIEWRHRFYTVKIKKGDPEIVFDIVKILEILQELGFYRYDDPTNGGQSVFVQIHDGKIRQLHDPKIIRDAFEDYILSLTNRKVTPEDGSVECEVTPDKLRRTLLKSINYYLGEDKLERLRPEEAITIMHDTYSTKYHYYRNCVVQVCADGVKAFGYDQLAKESAKRELQTGEKNGRYIWESSIMDRDFDISCINKHCAVLSGTGDFAMFCRYISGFGSAVKSKEAEEQHTLRFKALQSIIGYLMHGDYECNLKSVLFMDANLNGNSRANGGTGKGIIGKGLSFAMNRNEHDCKYISEAGKNFSPENERRYSNGDLSTQLIHIEDIKKDFDFEKFYNDVTESVPIRKMNVDRVMVRSKIMLSSNTPIDIITTGNSTARRLVIFELDNYFNSKHTPEDEFGRWLFGSKWTAEDWSAFDQFIVSCSYVYMRNKDVRGEDGRITGIIEPPLINYKRQLLESKLPTEFIGWFEDKISGAINAMVYCEFKKKELYKEFWEKYEAYANAQLYARAFTKWCKFYLEVMAIPSGEKRSTDDLLILYPDLNDKAVSVIYSGK